MQVLQQIFVSAVTAIFFLLSLVGVKNTEHPQLWILAIKKGILEHKLKRLEIRFAKSASEKDAEKLYCKIIALQNQQHKVVSKIESLISSIRVENLLDLHKYN